MEPYRPRRRPEVVQAAVDDGLVVLDTRVQRAHALRSPLDSVWACCDGETDLATICHRTQLELSAVDEMVGALRDADLLTTIDAPPVVSRRAALAGAAGVAAALVTTIALPPVAAAASGASTLGSTTGNPSVVTGASSAGSATGTSGTSRSSGAGGSGGVLAFTGSNIEDTTLAAGAVAAAGAAMVAATRLRRRGDVGDVPDTEA